MNHTLRDVYIRNYRSIEAASVRQCGNLNVFIGRNNAGKSNILTAIAIAMHHLRGGEIAAPWPAGRPADNFTKKDTTRQLKVGLVFNLSPDVNQMIQKSLTELAPQLANSIEQISQQTEISFVVRFLYLMERHISMLKVSH